MEQAVIEDDLAPGVGIFNPIRPIARVVIIEIESLPAFEEFVVTGTAEEDVVLIAADQMIRPALAVQPVDAIVASNHVIKLIAEW